MTVALSERLRTPLADSRRHAETEVAAGAQLTPILENLLLAVEAETEGRMLTSILLLDPDGKRLLHGAAPSLPQAYNAAIHGIEIGQGVGSCGTAAYLGHPVYVTDIETDPLWKDFKDLAAEHGLRACWSTPIIGSDRAVLGTFAIYHRAPRSPSPDELDAIRLISDTARMAIERGRAPP